MGQKMGPCWVPNYAQCLKSGRKLVEGRGVLFPLSAEKKWRVLGTALKQRYTCSSSLSTYQAQVLSFMSSEYKGIN